MYKKKSRSQYKRKKYKGWQNSKNPNDYTAWRLAKDAAKVVGRANRGVTNIPYENLK